MIGNRLCKCNFVSFFIAVTPLLLQPTPLVLRQIMCCSHLFPTWELQGHRWDRLWCHSHQLLGLVLSAVSFFFKKKKNFARVRQELRKYWGSLGSFYTSMHCWFSKKERKTNRALKAVGISFHADKMPNLPLSPAAVCPLWSCGWGEKVVSEYKRQETVYFRQVIMGASIHVDKTNEQMW